MTALDAKISQQGEPPQSPDIERVVLGACLLDKSAVMVVTTQLNAEAFYDPKNRYIFEAIKALTEASREVDSLTVVEELRSKKRLQIIGGPGAVSEYTNRIASSAHINEHILILKQYQMSRAQIHLGQDLIQLGGDPQRDVFEVNEILVDRVTEIQYIGDVKAHRTTTVLAQELKEKIERAAKLKGLTGIPSGYEELDQITGGWQSPDLVILAARPGMGKTAFMLCNAHYQVVRALKRIAVFSLEMSDLQLYQRLASIHIGLPASKFNNGDMTAEDWVQFNGALDGIIEDDRLIIVDDCYSMLDIVNKAKTLHLKQPLEAIYIDYLQLISGKKYNSREQEVSEASRRLKMLAKELGVPVIALSQLSREVEKRTNKRPILSDLRESGAIEQDADIVSFLYRPGYYNPDIDPSLSYLIIDKHRNGKLKDIELEWRANYTRFVDPTYQAINNANTDF